MSSGRWKINNVIRLEADIYLMAVVAYALINLADNQYMMIYKLTV